MVVGIGLCTVGGAAAGKRPVGGTAIRVQCVGGTIARGELARDLVGGYMLGSCKLELARGEIVERVVVGEVFTRGALVGGANSGELISGYALGGCRELTSWRWPHIKDVACKLGRWLHVQEVCVVGGGYTLGG